MPEGTIDRTAAPASVLVVEDDPCFGDAFAEAVCAAPDLHLAGVAANLADGLRLLDAHAPDVVLVDVGLPDGSGIELIAHAQRHHPHCEALVVTVFADEQVVFQCIAAGAMGYVLKDARGVDIAAQIRLLREGGSPITPSVARRVLGRLTLCPATAPAAPTAQEALSDREQAVLQLSAKGYNYEEIGRLLALSRHTVETYVKRIYRKLQVHSKTEAVYEGRKLGLVAD